ncbi:MAG: primosomal protein N' [Alphaproteobacteria bacterium]
MANPDLFASDDPPMGDEAATDVVQLLLPVPVPRLFSYLVDPELGVQPGSLARVSFHGRELVGVVWSLQPPDDLPDRARLKPVTEVLDLPPLSDKLRQFIDRAAAYVMAPPGLMLKTVLSESKAFGPPPLQNVVRLAHDAQDWPADLRMTPGRKAVREVLADGLAWSVRDVAERAGVSPGIVRQMKKAGMLVEEERLVEAAPIIAGPVKAGPKLSAEQQTAAGAMVKDIGQGFKPFLLDGVTGSGKSEVFFEAVGEALKQGQQALIMLPEIALTKSLLRRVEQRFGFAPTLWHSTVSPAQRRDAWRDAASGRARLVLGARSALFLPYRDLGIIIVDEEHESAYKQEEQVIYNGRDMAVLRASIEKVPVVLASATPALETWHNGEIGRYAPLHLPMRFGAAVLPEIEALDLRRHTPPRGRFLSPKLTDEMVEVLERGEQVLLFLNRRGYAPLTLCRSCGHRLECPNCTAWLVEHKSRRRLVCHHCGHGMLIPKDCPDCEAEDSLAPCGPGVERVAEEVRSVFPEARQLVLSSDLQQTPAQIQGALTMIADRSVDIIIGTQVIAKGHHFPEITLVGVVDADLGLAGGDPRASEKTFQLLQQVAGRAGRGDKPGRVMLQSFMPEHPVMDSLARGDRDGFYKAELAERRLGGLPPFGRLAALIISSPDEGLADQLCYQLAQAAPLLKGVDILGPAPAPIAIIRNNHRRRFLIRTGRDVAVQTLIRDWLARVEIPNRVRLAIDIDPYSFL